MMKKNKYITPHIEMFEVALEEGIAKSSNDCNGAYQGQGHGNGKGCKEWMIDGETQSLEDYNEIF